MTKKYAVLQKKLEELESEVNSVFTHPTETQSHQLASEDFDRRISFLRSLLSAELESHPSKPHHLHHIDQRLTELETKFQHWNNLQPVSPFDHIDTVSSCSCTESCFNDDGNCEDSDKSDSAELIFYENPGFVSEGQKEEMETLPEKVPIEDPETRVEKGRLEQRVNRGRWQRRSRKFSELVKGMLVLGLLGVFVALAHRTCCGCVKDKMEMEGYLRAT